MCSDERKPTLRPLVKDDLSFLQELFPAFPKLVTENVRELRAYFKKKLQIHAFFMHSCGDERFPTRKWDAVKRIGMESEQYLRTKLDWEGKLLLVNENEILEDAYISKVQLQRIQKIMQYAQMLTERSHA